MKPQFAHNVMTSFALWFDNHLLQKGEAYTNKTGIFENYTDPQIAAPYKVFGSQFKQWVGDSSITGATIPTGVYVSGNFLPRQSGVILDFENGRALISGAAATASVSGAFAIKDFNIYFTNESEEDIIVEKKYIENPRFFSAVTGAIAPYEPAVPAIFLSFKMGKNEDFAFGGLDMSCMYITAIILAENLYQLDGALSLFQDTKDKVITQIPFDASPYNEFGDLKSGSYSYTNLCSNYTGEEPLFVEEVDTAKLTDKIRKNIENNLHIGFIDFKVSNVRNPRL